MVNKLRSALLLGVVCLELNAAVPQKNAASPAGVPYVPPANLAASVTNLSFGPLALGATSTPLTVVFTNSGGYDVNFVTGPAFTSATSAAYQVTANSCSSILAVGTSCSVSVTFTPATQGTTNGSIQAVWVGGGVLTNQTTTVALSGVSAVQNQLLFVPVTPCRVADTRNPNGLLGGPEVAANTTRTFAIQAGPCGIPATAAAYSLNVTAVPDTGIAFMSVFPAGETMPTVSTLNSDGRVKANAAIIPAGTNGGVSIYSTDNTNVVIDINGYFAPASNAGLAFYPVTPCRVADTRVVTQWFANSPIAAGTTRTFAISGACGVPTTAQAYSLNLTAIPKWLISYLTAWPTGLSQPLASTLNAPVQAVTANAAILPAGSNGSISVYSTDITDLAIDVNGYFAPAGAGGLSFYTVAPCRAYDTRASGAPFSGLNNSFMLAGQEGACNLPTAPAYVVNATTVSPGYLFFLSLYPTSANQPLVSTLNSGPGVASNMAIVGSTKGQVSAYASGSTYLILDVYGYFAQ